MFKETASPFFSCAEGSVSNRKWVAWSQRDQAYPAQEQHSVGHISEQGKMQRNPHNIHTVKPAIPLSTRRRPPRAHALTKQQTSWTPVPPPSKVAQGRLVGLKEPDFGRLSSFTLLLGGPWASVQGNRLSFFQLRWGKCFKQKVSGMEPEGPSIPRSRATLGWPHLWAR